jgi:hypothetical protein
MMETPSDTAEATSVYDQLEDDQWTREDGPSETPAVADVIETDGSPEATPDEGGTTIPVDAPAGSDVYVSMDVVGELENGDVVVGSSAQFMATPPTTAEPATASGHSSGRGAVSTSSSTPTVSGRRGRRRPGASGRIRGRRSCGRTARRRPTSNVSPAVKPSCSVSTIGTTFPPVTGPRRCGET